MRLFAQGCAKPLLAQLHIREPATPESVVPAELRHAPGTVEERLSVLQENYRRWANLLEVWPEIPFTAREIPPPGIANHGVV